MNSQTRFLTGLFLVLVLVLGTGRITGAENDRIFRAGAFAIDVTPTDLPIRVAGSIGQKTANEITDPLHARCLVLDDGESRIAIAVVDSCLMGRRMLDAAKEKASQATGIPVNRMLISATHTHSAPVVKGVHGNDPETDYRAFLRDRIAEGIERAATDLRPARVGWGSKPCHEFVFCRRWEMKPGTAFTVPFTGRDFNRAQMNPGRDNPDKMGQVGPVDPDVTVLSVETADGKPLALLANYSTHYAGAPEISADYFGVFADRMKELLNAAGETPAFVGIMSNGTSGDANCINFGADQPSFDRFSVAEAVAEAAYEACREIEYQDWVPVAMAEEELSLQVRMPTAEEVAEAKRYVEENLSDRPVRSWEDNYARETVLLSQLPPTRELKLQAIRVGALGITAIPCEVYGSTGLAMKQRSPFSTTLNISLANGCVGYLPPPDQFALGGYTTWRARSSCLEIGAEPKIRRTIHDLLVKVAAKAQ